MKLDVETGAGRAFVSKSANADGAGISITGSRMVNVVPSPGFDANSMLPP